MSRTWNEVEKELFTPEEIQEAEFKAALMDTIVKAHKETDISKERLVEMSVEFLDDLRLGEPALA